MIDDEISLTRVFIKCDPDQIYFVGCSFSGDGEGILREFFSVSKVGFIRCNLSYNTLKRLLISNDPYNNFEVLDLTGNELSKDPKQFVEILRRNIVSFKTIDKVIFADNGFDETIIPMLKKVCGTTIGEIIL